MKHGKLWLALAALSLMCGVVLADNNVLDHGSYFQNASNGAKTDGSGNASVSEASKDRSNWIVYASAIDDTVSAGNRISIGWPLATTAASFTAESTIVYPAAEYRRFAIQLWVKQQGGDTTNTTVRLAVQIRGHATQNSDSTNTTPWYGWCSATGDVDSTGHVTSAKGAQVLTAAWSGERVFTFDSQRGVAALRFGDFFGAPNGVLMDLVDPRGNYFWAPFISIRVRCLGTASSTATKPRITLNLMMGS